jgi:hypothetical protein
LQRGASKQAIYGPARLKKSNPTRLFIDAQTIQQWRQKGFFSVSNEQTYKSSPEDNLHYSLLYQMLKLKHEHPQKQQGKIDASINLDINNQQQCATLGEFLDFSNNYPNWGMPYGLPNLSKNEYKLLVQWIAQGSPAEKLTSLSQTLKIQINRWEHFLNNPSLKQQLVSRYLFEHLFLANLYFPSTKGQPIFFRLLRSTTPPGQKIKEIVTTRPYDSPYKPNTLNSSLKKQPFYYRLQREHAQIVIKNHNPYALSEQKLKRIKQLFIEPNYHVKQLPSYQPELASNPFKTFKDIPPQLKYKFLLDDSRFFIQGFIKGPVCRGQISLNVIDDYFWVVFIDPQAEVSSLDADFLNKNINYFQLPAGKESTLNPLSLWTKYWTNQKKYIKAKIKSFKNIPSISLNRAMDYIYTGKSKNEGSNTAYKTANAALTIFRHLDSASVSYGLVTNNSFNSTSKEQTIVSTGPETTWVVDYPILERIHYLLVAGFNIYGNVGHQLNTRIYMDFLRMEGEDNFLALLPISARNKIRDSWYKGIRSDIAKYFKAPIDWLSKTYVTGYKTKNYKRELNQKIQTHLATSQKNAKLINQGLITPYNSKNRDKDSQQKVQQFIQKISSLKGKKLELIPNVTFLRIKMNNKSQDLVFTIINNKAHKHLNSLFEDDKPNQRDYKYDTLSIVNWLEGSYPNFFLDVNINELTQFSQQFIAIKNEHDYKSFIQQFGIRRTSKKFWEITDWFTEYYKNTQPIQAGYFDLNRYEDK